MQTWTYPARVRSDADDDHTVRFDDFPEAICGATTVKEALRVAAEVLEEAVLGRLADGEAIPSPRAAGADEVLVVLDPTTAARAALAEAMRCGRVSNTALAAKLGKTEGAVRRLTSGKRGVKLETVLDALALTGQRGVFATL